MTVWTTQTPRVHQKRIGERVTNEILMTLRSERKFRREVSLFEPIGTDKEGNEIHLVDVIEGEEHHVVEDLYREGMLQKLSHFLLPMLDERERELIGLRYGLDGRKDLTQREVAKKMGISRSYVSRLEKRALNKLKQGLAESEL